MPAPKAIAKYAALAMISAFALVYLVDWAVVFVRSLRPSPTRPYESFTVPRVLAIPENGGKTEYQIDQLHPEQTVTCVHSLFPHSGRNPCWYVQRKMMQPIPM
ncbi:MAG TPA: hypothetical protein VJP87_05125 [Candidatus Acidoferrales bacterium]|nr:hypothetical protein [Candidatus Acidoferrales bacterium]